MKSIALCTILLSLGLSTNIAMADSTVPKLSEPVADAKAKKIAVIKKMYQQDVDNQEQEHPAVLQQYASKDLKAAMQLEQDYFDKTQMSCHIGHDVLWDSQDPDYTQDKKFSVTKQGLVQVDLAQGSTVDYEVTCDDNACLVNDVIVDNNDTSLKAYLKKECQ